MNEQRICVLINVVHLEIHWPMIFLNSRGPQSWLKQKEIADEVELSANFHNVKIFYEDIGPQFPQWIWYHNSIS
jgi:hypothetical protein